MRLIYNARLALDDGLQLGYVIVDGDTISQVVLGTPDNQVLEMCDETLDAHGAMLLPGVIDTHVHFREPGLTHKATIASESYAAVAGGVTSYIDMPNVQPPTVSQQALEEKWQRAAHDSWANYSFYVGATNTNVDHLIHDIDYSRVPGVKVFLGSSTGGMLVENGQTLRRLFAQVPAMIAVHCEDEQLVRHGIEEARLRYGEDIPPSQHPFIRSSEACYQSTRLAVELAHELGTRLHVLHVSTERELKLFTSDALSAKQVTAEACVGHLWFCDQDYDRLGCRIKVNPAIKTSRDREALRAALSAGEIDVVSTDHAPHTLAEKCQKYLKSPSGMPLAQFSLVAMLELAHQNFLSIHQVVQKMCHAPARLFSIGKRGYLRPGYYADMVLVQEVQQGWTISDADVLSLCGWTPLDGAVMHHRVLCTWVNGVEVYPSRPSSTPAQPLLFKC